VPVAEARVPPLPLSEWPQRAAMHGRRDQRHALFIRLLGRRYRIDMEYTVFDTPGELANSAADLLQAEIEADGRVALGLAGGSTPRATYESLASRSIDWMTSVAWLTDERWVAPMSPDSNQRMIRETIVRPTGVQFVTPDTTLHSPTEAADRFTQTLIGVLATAARRVTLLGMGTDGHTASLFPGTAALETSGPQYIDNFVPSLDAWRLTATFDLLGESDIVYFLVAGSSKSEMVASIAAGADVPAARVSAEEKVVWLLDREAAAHL
jgi:6-phosphogluconolactonase